MPLKLATPPAPLIEVSHIHTRFGAAVVHDDVSLTINKGEVFAIAGGNGSGKSVLMREMILLQQPTAGDIQIFGQNIRTMNASRHLGAAAPLRRAVSTWRVVQLADRGGKRRRAAARAYQPEQTIDRRAGLAEDRQHRLSHGQRRQISQRTERRHAPARRPGARHGAWIRRLLFLDEPTSGLDPISAAGFDELIQQLREWFRLTIVIITHDLDSLWRIADRVAVLGNGKVLGIGTHERTFHVDRSVDSRVFLRAARPRGQGASMEPKVNYTLVGLFIALLGAAIAGGSSVAEPNRLSRRLRPLLHLYG